MDSVEKLLTACREAGLRKTQPLVSVLKEMVKFDLPFSMLELEKNGDLAKTCDRTTIFRIFQRLENIGLLRRLSFIDEKAAKFTLRHGDSHQEYLICKVCSDVKALKMGCPVHSIQKDIAQESGYQEMAHELTFYGVCPDCQ